MFKLADEVAEGLGAIRVFTLGAASLRAERIETRIAQSPNADHCQYGPNHARYALFFRLPLL